MIMDLGLLLWIGNSGLTTDGATNYLDSKKVSLILGPWIFDFGTKIFKNEQVDITGLHNQILNLCANPQCIKKSIA